ncbi:hypothetical protein CKAN_01910900 [Cinnamomum micranthum f. kanehirae]|uniref:Uncharacterized protein n=1 Tax=Cinnamomum micranthum f. kanehirae TaxID=337451 RepID=A0A3S3MUK3_9MAGN|nr:hypothetical protein CKAN_01910900 [Cinnamomum micranthum f. kanehirae]
MAGTWGLGLPQENMFPAQIFENGPFNCAQGGQRERQVCYGFIGTLYVGPPDCLYMLSDITEKKSRPPKVYVDNISREVYNQDGWNQDNSRLEGYNTVATEGDIAMKTKNGGPTNHFDNRGSTAQKRIMGVNGGQVTK